MDKKVFYQEYIKISVPLILQSLVTTLVSMVDNLMVGQLGDDAIAAVAMGNKILGMVVFTVFGISAATSVFIAQYFGAKNVAKQKEAFRIGLIMSMMLLLVTSAAFVLFSKDIIPFFIQGETIERYALDYIRIMLVGFIPYVLSINYSTASKVIGQVKLPLIASLIGVVVNTCLNYLFIFGNFGFSAMGVSGAAIATVIARFVEFFVIYGTVRYYHFSFNTRFMDIFHITPTLFKEVFSKALPLAVNEIIWSLAQATVLKIYGSRGGEVVAAYSISDTTTSIFHSFMHGFSAVTPILISQRLGANQLKEAYWNAKMMLKTAVLVAMFLGMTMYGASFIIPNLYQVSLASRVLAISMIQLTSMLYWINLGNAQLYFIMRAGGDMKSTLMMDGVFYWCITIPTLALVTYFTDWSVFMIFIVGQCCELIKLGVSFRFFLKKRWVKNLT